MAQMITSSKSKTMKGEYRLFRRRRMKQKPALARMRDVNRFSARSVMSDSLKSNTDYWETLKKYPSFKSPQALGFSWVSTNNELRTLAQKHFASVLDTFCVADAPVMNAKGSVVEVVSIDQTAFNTDICLKQLPQASISVGGPSALVMAYFEAERFANRGTGQRPPIFSTQSVTQSNAYGSALQIHQRYAQRMAYTDYKYEGWHLLKVGLQRFFSTRTLEEALVADYLTVDFDWDSIWRNDPLAIADIYIKNELTTWHDKLNRWRDAETTGSKTYHYAKESTRILKAIDADVGGIFSQEGAISIGLSKKEYDAIEKKNKWLLKRYHIESIPISVSTIAKEYGFFPDFSKGGGAYYYPADGYLQPDFWHKLEKGILKNKGLVASWTLKKIVLTEQQDKVVGIVVEEDSTERFIRTDHLYVSLGYNTKYKFKTAKNSKTLWPTPHTPSIENVTTGTGFSGIALIFGNGPNVPIAFNSHHTTPIARAYDSVYGPLSLVKTTGGALMGSYTQYQVQHAANNVWYNEKIFGPEKFRLLATKGCSRSINSGNSGKFTVFPGLVIGTGRGGKGVTDMCADAVVAGQLLKTTEPPYRAHTLDIATSATQNNDFSYSFWCKNKRSWHLGLADNRLESTPSNK